MPANNFNSIMDDAVKNFAHKGANSRSTIEKVSKIAEVIDDPLLLLWAQTKASELKEREMDSKANGTKFEANDLNWDDARNEYPLFGSFGNALKSALETVTGAVKETFTSSVKNFYGKLTQSWKDTSTISMDNVEGFTKDPQNLQAARDLNAASQSMIKEINHVAQNASQTPNSQMIEETKEKIKAVNEVSAPAQRAIAIAEEQKKSQETQLKSIIKEEEVFRDQLIKNNQMQNTAQQTPREMSPREVAQNILAHLRADAGVISAPSNDKVPYVPITQKKVEEKAADQKDYSLFNPLNKRK